MCKYHVRYLHLLSENPRKEMGPLGKRENISEPTVSLKTPKSGKGVKKRKARRMRNTVSTAITKLIHGKVPMFAGVPM